MHRRERRSYIHRHRMALRSQERLLLRWLVAEPTVLLLGNRI